MKIREDIDAYSNFDWIDFESIFQNSNFKWLYFFIFFEKKYFKFNLFNCRSFLIFYSNITHINLHWFPSFPFETPHTFTWLLVSPVTKIDPSGEQHTPFTMESLLIVLINHSSSSFFLFSSSFGFPCKVGFLKTLMFFSLEPAYNNWSSGEKQIWVTCRLKDVIV